MNDMKQQPEAMRLADWLEDQYDPTHHQAMSAAELLRLHAENQQLRSDLEAVGAGGVGPLMPPVAERPGVLMPSRSLVDQVIREIARYCNTGEMDDAESLLAELQFSIDPAQQPPTTEQSSAVEQPQSDQDGLRASNEYLLGCLRDWSELAIRLHTRVAELESQAAAPPALELPQGEQGTAAMAKVVGMDEYGPMLLWNRAWTDFPVGTKLYTHSQRKPLTDEQITDLWIKHACSGAYIHAFAQAIERTHGIGGEE